MIARRHDRAPRRAGDSIKLFPQQRSNGNPCCNTFCNPGGWAGAFTQASRHFFRCHWVRTWVLVLVLAVSLLGLLLPRNQRLGVISACAVCSVFVQLCNDIYAAGMLRTRPFRAVETSANRRSAGTVTHNTECIIYNSKISGRSLQMHCPKPLNAANNNATQHNTVAYHNVSRRPRKFSWRMWADGSFINASIEVGNGVRSVTSRVGRCFRFGSFDSKT